MTVSGERGAERPLRAVLLVVAVAAAFWSVVVWFTGGFRTTWFGLRVSASDPIRPLAIACIVVAIYVWRWPRSVVDAGGAVGRVLVTRPPLTAGLLALAVLAVAIGWGSTVAAGADSYGYVSQAWLIRHGRILETQDIASRMPWPFAQWMFTPLGYRPGPGDTIVPTYALGLPLLMAGFQTLVGDCGAFLVVPICAALTVMLTYALGRQLAAPPSVALWAAALVATSPPFLYMVMWPMSDIPVAAAWTSALVLVCAGRPWLAGIAMALTTLMRPNLFLLPVSVLIWAAARDWCRVSSDRPRRFVWPLALGVCAGVLAIAALNQHLYGSPLMSGYGAMSYLFDWRNVPANAVLYGRWLFEAQTPTIVCAGLYFLAPKLFPPADVPFARLLLGGTVVALLVSYFFYFVFDVWWYLRFLLPMWPILLVAMVFSADTVLRRWLPRLRPLAVSTLAIALIAHGLRMSRESRVFELGEGERRYVEAARYVAVQTDPRSVILCLQHSGSIRYYANRATVRYDWIDRAWLDRVVEYLQSNGRRPYILLEDWEVDKFRDRFAATSRIGRLDFRAAAVLETPTKVALYDPILLDRTSEQVSMPDRTRKGGWPCAPPSESPVAAH